MYEKVNFYTIRIFSFRLDWNASSYMGFVVFRCNGKFNRRACVTFRNYFRSLYLAE